jgi:Ca2+-binding EF-hand superfamily protein
MPPKRKQLTIEEIEQYLELFERWDKDKDGKLSLSDLELTQQEEDSELLQEVLTDVRDSGIVMQPKLFMAVVRALRAKTEEDDHDQRLRAQFSEIDHDGSGCIDATELLKLMHKLGHTFVDEDFVSDMIEEVDQNGDGRLQFEEFLKLMKNR